MNMSPVPERNHLTHMNPCQVIEHLCRDLAEVQQDGAHWTDANGKMRNIKPFMGPWVADHEEAMSLTGAVKVSDCFCLELQYLTLTVLPVLNNKEKSNKL